MKELRTIIIKMPIRPIREKNRRANDREYDLNQRTGPLAIAGKIRRSRKWTEYRLFFLQKFPLCCDPFGEHEKIGYVAPAETAHHVLGVAERPDLAFEETNIKPLCNHCHGLVEQAIRRSDEKIKRIKWL